MDSHKSVTLFTALKVILLCESAAWSAPPGHSSMPSAAVAFTKSGTASLTVSAPHVSCFAHGQVHADTVSGSSQQEVIMCWTVLTFHTICCKRVGIRSYMIGKLCSPCTESIMW